MTTSTIGLWTLTAFSARKLLQNRRWVIVFILAALVASVMGYAATQEMAGPATASDMLLLLMVTFLLPVLALIYGASMIRNEVDDRSIVQVITSPLDRRTSYLGYYLALVAVLSLLVTLITFLGGLSFLAFSSNGDGVLDIALAFIAVQLLGVLVYSSLFLMLGTLLKQPIYLGLLYVFVWEGFLGSVPGAIGDYTIRHHLQVIASGMIDRGTVASVTGDGGASMIILIILTAVFVLLGAFLFREMEVA